MLRYKADRRTIFFLILTISIFICLWNLTDNLNFVINTILYSSLLVLSVTVSVITHNHQHLPIWKNKWLNIITDNWLTIFYGFPIFGWMPTHNLNHHKHVNTEKDYTRTYRVSEKNNLITLLTYPSLSGIFQQKAIFKYLKTIKLKSRKKYYYCLLQFLSLFTWIGVGLLINWKSALLYIIIPQQLSIYSVLIFNYVQHIHADENDAYNNSRNFTGKILNCILLNNGYHTIHHLKPSLHWSVLPNKHNEIAHKIDASLNEHNFIWYLFRVYILGIFIPRLRTNNLRFKSMQNT